MRNTSKQTQAKPTLFQRVGSFLDAIAYTETDYRFEVLGNLQREQAALEARIAELEARGS